MRRDMKKVIIDTGRVGGTHTKGEVRQYQKQKQEDFENSPFHISMRPRGRGTDRKTQSDRLNPLVHYLRTNVSRQWDDVFSEICEVNDRRGLLGFHLLTHLGQYVVAKGLKSPSYRYPEFFQDSDGTLQEVKEVRNPYRKFSRVKEEDFIVKGEDGWDYIWVKRVWFKIKKEVIPYYREVVYDEEGKKVWGTGRWYENVIHHKVQVGKKELKKVRELLKEL